jgi:hypothetical protein
MCDGSGHLGLGDFMSFHSLFRLAMFGLCAASLAACDVPRPVGSFTYDAGRTLDDITKEQPAPDQDDEPDSTLPPPSDAEVPSVVEPPMPVDPSNPLSQLQGNYLMRVDVYSEASVTQSGTTLVTSNRVSNLLLAKLTLNADGKLVGEETLCNQSYYTKCISNCSEWKTEVVSAVVKQHFQLQKVTRPYDVDGAGKLNVSKAVLSLGFDEDADLGALPTEKSDPRVWNTDSNGVVIYGLSTRVDAKVTALALNVVLKCLVGAVQRFATAFSGQLDISNPEALTLKPMRVDTAGTAGDAVDATGEPAGTCNKDSIAAAGAEDNEATTTVRFRRTDLANCPASIAEFEAKFPGTNDAPKATDLM